MKRKLFLPLLLLSGLSLNRAAAQCTATLTSTGDCYPITLTANANFAMDSIIWKKDGNIVQTYVASLGFGTVVAGGNGQGGASNQLNQPMGMNIDNAGNIYIADGPNHRIQKWAPNATTGVTVAGGNGQGSTADKLNFPTGLFVDTNGDVYVSDCINNRIQKWAPNATVGVTVAGGNGFGSGANQFAMPGGIFVKNGDIYVVDGENARVQKWAANATTGVTVAGGNGFGAALNQLSIPAMNGNVFVDQNNNIYVTEYTNHRVTKWAPNATAGVIVAGGNGQGAGANQLNYPTGLSVDNLGGVFVTEYGNHRVQYWPANATTGTTIVGGNGSGSALNQTSQPTGFAKFNDTLFVCEYGNHRVTRFTAGATITNTYVITEPGVYKAIVKNTTGCADSAALTFDFPAEILITPPGPLHLCEGDNVTLDVTAHPTLSYQWLKDNTTTGTNTSSLTINESGVYKVITNVNGNCIDTTATVTATVHDLPVPVITNNNNVLTTGTYTTYQWYLNANVIPGATSNTFTATQNGIYSVEVTNEYDCAGTSANLEVTGIVGIADIALFDGVKVYPNPAKDAIYLDLPKSFTSASIEIITLQGQAVLAIDPPAGQNVSPLKVNIDTIAPGAYFLKVNTRDVSKTFKIIKY